MTGLIKPGMAARLRALTPARVALETTGVSQSSRPVLAFQLQHALARDAVHSTLDGPSGNGAGVLRLHSAARDRTTYLHRPDLGRELDDASRGALPAPQEPGPDLVIAVADGLSALAVQRHALPLLGELLPLLAGVRVGPVCIVEQGRVAIGDQIGALLAASMALVLIGERPGLSAFDSMGAYLTWNPRPGRTDAERICVSNIRPEGLTYQQAARQLADALADAMGRKSTGVALEAVPAAAWHNRLTMEGTEP